MSRIIWLHTGITGIGCQAIGHLLPSIYMASRTSTSMGTLKPHRRTTLYYSISATQWLVGDKELQMKLMWIANPSMQWTGGGQGGGRGEERAKPRVRTRMGGGGEGEDESKDKGESEGEGKGEGSNKSSQRQMVYTSS